jgi:hypothetical protein
MEKMTSHIYNTSHRHRHRNRHRAVPLTLTLLYSLLLLLFITTNSKQHAVTAVSASATATAEGQQYDASVLKANHPDTHHHDDSSTDSDTINAVRNKISSNIPTSVKDDINIKNGINKKPPQERERWWHRFAILKNELTELLTQQTHLTLLLFSCGLLIGVILPLLHLVAERLRTPSATTTLAAIKKTQ